MAYVPEFGDREYLESELNSQYTSHSYAPVTFHLGNPLRQAYQYAQNHAQIFIAQSYPFNIRDMQGDLAVKRQWVGISSNDWIGVARGWRNYPAEFSHLVCVVCFAAYAFNRVRVTHRLTVDVGATCDSNSHEIEIEDAQDHSAQVSNATLVASQNWLQPRLVQFPFTQAFKIHTDRFDLNVSNVDPGAVALSDLRVDAKCNGLNTSGLFNNPVPYQPLFCMVYGEMRYPNG